MELAQQNSGRIFQLKHACVALALSVLLIAFGCMTAPPYRSHPISVAFEDPAFMRQASCSIELVKESELAVVPRIELAAEIQAILPDTFSANYVFEVRAATTAQPIVACGVDLQIGGGGSYASPGFYVGSISVPGTTRYAPMDLKYVHSSENTLPGIHYFVVGDSLVCYVPLYDTGREYFYRDDYGDTESVRYGFTSHKGYALIGSSFWVIIPKSRIRAVLEPSEYRRNDEREAYTERQTRKEVTKWSRASFFYYTPAFPDARLSILRNAGRVAENPDLSAMELLAISPSHMLPRLCVHLVSFGYEQEVISALRQHIERVSENDIWFRHNDLYPYYELLLLLHVARNEMGEALQCAMMMLSMSPPDWYFDRDPSFFAGYSWDTRALMRNLDVRLRAHWPEFYRQLVDVTGLPTTIEQMAENWIKLDPGQPTNYSTLIQEAAVELALEGPFRGRREVLRISENYAAGISIESDNAEIYKAYFNCRLALDESKDDARQELLALADRIVEFDPATAYLGRARVLEAHGDLEAAKREYNRACPAIA